MPSQATSPWRVRTGYEELWINNPGGADIYAHVHRPVAAASGGAGLPGVIIVPGGGSPGTAYDGFTEVTADDVAALGAVVLHYDPSGRGKTAGEEDYWGGNHQRELSAVIERFFAIDGINCENVGVLSFSIGITIAAGALCRFPVGGCQIKYLFDWEGPSNRVNITKNDTHEPLLKFHMSNNEFWAEREAASFIGGITCDYFRYQASTDHMQGAYKGHAIELLNKATQGRARSSRCNDNLPNIYYEDGHPEKYRWVPAKSNQKYWILKYLRQMQDEL
ncbi:MAG: hypothetical protein HQK97_02880 [Nitrospirae bacterium]|nr:hypothetical protein [Nitrospirota bacterium]